MATALFTGAGASRAIGYPLTGELLPRVRAEIKSGDLFKGVNGRKRDESDRKELKRCLLRLFPGFARVPEKQLPLITDVFSLVEYALLSGEALPVGNEAALRRFRDLLKQAITDVLIGDFLAEFDLRKEDQAREARVLKQLTAWVRDQDFDIGLVTTNYDIGLEHEVYKRISDSKLKATLDLGFDWRDAGTGEERTRPSGPRRRVYKLHGSLDQLRCRWCGYVYFNPEGSIAWQAFRTVQDQYNTCDCHKHARLELHIVSPSLVRDIREANLLSVWRSAHEWLREADHWVIVGYSLPPEDLAVRSLLLRAYATAKKRPKITVVQLGDADRLRYHLLFPRCTYRSDGLEGFLADS